MRRTIWSALAVGGTFAGPALAQDPPDYGLDWATIGDPGNRNVDNKRYPGLGCLEIGGIDYVYRMSRTEITVAQWFEYVNAYWPYHDGSLATLNFTSFWIQPQNPDPGPGEDPEYEIIRPGAEHFPANMSWHHAARYANWLHNGKVKEEWAFQDGAYDTSTFTRNPDGSRNDQRRHHPGAKFWIPTLSEWTKAAYWDPSRGGEGDYWLFPDGGDEPLVPGYPELGGESNAGHIDGDFWELLDDLFASGTYPDSLSPWGLLDLSGGVTEWTEDASQADGRSRWVKGGDFLNQGAYVLDRLDIVTVNSPDFSANGFRIASLPAPGGLWLLGGLFLLNSRSRR